MDPISVLGVVFILIGVFVGSLLKGVSPGAFFGVPAAFLIVILASLGAGMVSAGRSEVKSLPKLVRSYALGAIGEKVEGAGDASTLRDASALLHALGLAGDQGRPSREDRPGACGFANLPHARLSLNLALHHSPFVPVWPWATASA